MARILIVATALTLTVCSSASAAAQLGLREARPYANQGARLIHKEMLVDGARAHGVTRCWHVRPGTETYAAIVDCKTWVRFRRETCYQRVRVFKERLSTYLPSIGGGDIDFDPSPPRVEEPRYRIGWYYAGRPFCRRETRSTPRPPQDTIL